MFGLSESFSESGLGQRATGSCRVSPANHVARLGFEQAGQTGHLEDLPENLRIQRFIRNVLPQLFLLIKILLRDG